MTLRKKPSQVSYLLSNCFHIALEFYATLFFWAAVLVIAAAGLRWTGHPVVSDWALIAFVAVPAPVMIVAIAAVFNRKLSVKGSAKGASGNVDL